MASSSLFPFCLSYPSFSRNSSFLSSSRLLLSSANAYKSAILIIYLYYSLYCLLEKRLGFELYRPIGIDWFNEGYWKIAEPYNNSIDTINQFLESDLISPERYHATCGYYNHSCKDDIYHIYNPIHDYYQKAIKIETFKNLKFLNLNI